jgi:membrane protein DedA with SNARE-associated domain
MSTPPLPGIFHTLAPVLNDYGYLAVAGFVFLEDFGVPVPGETILIAAAVYAGAGQLNIVAVGVIAVLAAIVGDNVGFAIGYFGGRPLISRYGRYLLLSPRRVEVAQRWFAQHGGRIVTVARFIEGLRQANGIIAGITRMRWPRFLAFNALGAVLWVALWTGVGYASGRHLATIYPVAGRALLIAAGVFLLLLVARFIWGRCQRKGPTSAASSGKDARTTREAPDRQTAGRAVWHQRGFDRAWHRFLLTVAVVCVLTAGVLVLLAPAARHGPWILLLLSVAGCCWLIAAL